jgi:hypothetical protein
MIRFPMFKTVLVASLLTTTLLLVACGDGDFSGYASLPNVTLTVSPDMIRKGESATLYWTTSNVTSCTEQSGFGYTTGWYNGKGKGSVSTGPVFDSALYGLNCTYDYYGISFDTALLIVSPL